MDSEAHDTHRSTRQLIRHGAIIVGGIVTAAAVIFILTDGLGLARLMIGAAGVILVAFGLMGRRIVDYYSAAALITVNVVVALVAVEVLATLALKFIPPPPGQVDGRTYLSYYQAQDWGDEIWKEQYLAGDERYEPFVVWRRKPFDGSHITVNEQGIRHTPGAVCRDGAYTVFVFGGSTVWGDGVPDWATVPAYVQSELDAAMDRPVCVMNLGESAWVSTQGVVELVRWLQNGDRPDLVVFYDGSNDISTAWEFGEAGVHFALTEIAERVEETAQPNPLRELVTATRTYELLTRLIPPPPANPDVRTELAAYDPEALSDDIVQTYLTNYRTVKALAAEYGFAYAFFWQPALLYGQKPLSGEEQAQLATFNELWPGLSDLFKAVYPKVEAAAADFDQLHYIADLLQDQTDLFYVDEIHLTPEGNKLVAKTMINMINEQLQLFDQNDNA